MNRRRVQLWQFVFAGCLAAHLSAAVCAAAAIDWAPLEALARAELKRNNVPGCAVAVVLGQEIIFSRGFGIANVDTGEPVKADMLFRLGSTTKMFTAATLAALAEEGRLRLDAPIGESVEGLAPRLARVTPHQLLTHTAGLADLTVMEGPHDETALAANARALADSLAFLEPERIYSYSNPGYWLAGLVAEAVGGKPYADMVAARVLGPCGMTRSTFRPTVAMTWPLAVGHGPEGRDAPKVVRPLADNAAGWPAGQLFSTAPELARFCIAFLNGGRLDGRPALPESVIENLSTPHTAVPGGERWYSYGLACRDDEQGLRWLSHGGSRTGYGSHLRMCPEKKFAVVILCNKTGASLPRIADRAVELALGIAVRSPEPRVPAPLTAAELRRYAGVYTNGRTTIRLVARDGRLMAPLGELKKVGEDRLRLGRGESGESGESAELVFVPGADGRIEFLVRNGRALKRTAN